MGKKQRKTAAKHKGAPPSLGSNTRFGNFSGMTTSDLLALTLATSSQPSSRKLQNYESFHRILLVGEGDFSFARALAAAIGTASRIIASSLDSQKEVLLKYSGASLCLEELTRSGATILHNVDCTKLSTNKRLTALVGQDGKFDRIVFQFPHKGGSQKEDVEDNRLLLAGFFSEAMRILEEDGEIHVTLRDTPFYHKWHIEEIAKTNGLNLQRRVPFESDKFKSLGYTPQRTDPRVREAPGSENAYVHVFKISDTLPATSSVQDDSKTTKPVETQVPKASKISKSKLKRMTKSGKIGKRKPAQQRQRSQPSKSR